MGTSVPHRRETPTTITVTASWLNWSFYREQAELALSTPISPQCDRSSAVPVIYKEVLQGHLKQLGKSLPPVVLAIASCHSLCFQYHFILRCLKAVGCGSFWLCPQHTAHRTNCLTPQPSKYCSQKDQQHSVVHQARHCLPVKERD